MMRKDRAVAANLVAWQNRLVVPACFGAFAGMGMPKETIKGEIVRLDYADFRSKAFVGCKLVYEGGRPPTLMDCDFDGCEFVFEGRALSTVQFLHAVAHGGGGGAELVVNVILGLQDWKPTDG